MILHYYTNFEKSKIGKSNMKHFIASCMESNMKDAFKDKRSDIFRNTLLDSIKYDQVCESALETQANMLKDKEKNRELYNEVIQAENELDKLSETKDKDLFNEFKEINI